MQLNMTLTVCDMPQTVRPVAGKGAAVRCMTIDDPFEGYAVLYHDKKCSFELLSLCLLAGPLWGSSQAEAGRF